MPCYFVIVWLLCRKRLTTKDRMKAWGINMASDACDLCKGSLETMDHLFFECPVSRIVWQKLIKLCLVQRAPFPWQQELQWVCSHWKSNSFPDQVRRLALAVTVYYLWKARNQSIFLKMLLDLYIIFWRL